MIKTFKQQKVMAKKVEQAYAKGGRLIRMFMPCQSGKTGSIIETAKLLKTKYNKSSYFITAVPDIQLRDQNKIAFKGSAVTVLDKFNLTKGIDNHSLDYLRSQIKPNQIIFLDEAHFGTGMRSMLSTFFEPLVDHLGCCLITVTATDFDQLYSNIQHNQVGVSLARAEMPGYWGVTEMLQSGQVFDIGELNNPKASRHFHFALGMFEQQEPGYFIVRVANSRKQQTSLAEFIKKAGYEVNVITYDQSSSSDISIDFLEHTPSRPTVVIIKNFWRCGKVLPGKQNIRAVWESSNTNLDVTVQGLVGRMCGYDSNKDCRIYSNRKMLEIYSAYEQCPNRDAITYEQAEKLGKKKKLSQKVSTKALRSAKFSHREITPDEFLEWKDKVVVRKLSNIGEQNKADYIRWRNQGLNNFKGSFGTSTDGKENIYIFDENTVLFPEGDPELSPIKNKIILIWREGRKETDAVEGKTSRSMFNLLKGGRNVG